MKLTTLTDEARLALGTLASRTGGLVSPSLRLGVTGLARSGKTVFLTALVHNLLHGGRLPVFAPYAEGRLARARLQPQPDDAVPRFAYEDHVRALIDKRIWPESTRRIAELRVTIEYESASFLNRNIGPGRLHLDLVDYPGEWLLDLPLLTKDYRTWAAESLAEARRPIHAESATRWLSAVSEADAGASADEERAATLAEAFTGYLKAVREEDTTPLAFPPGRFLMPGDLEGSPALTFAPLDPPSGAQVPDSLWAMMERRYEAYKSHVVRPFFRDHFARLDRQIVLVDVLAALNAGPEAVRALQTSLEEILGCFRPGRLSWLTRLVDRRVDRLMFAATKADHVHHTDHDRLEAILETLVEQARVRAGSAGAEVDVAAIAAVRATREGRVRQNGDTLPAIIGTPLPGERVDGTVYDGESEIALFPGDLPKDPRAVLGEAAGDAGALAFLRFRPPLLEETAGGATLSLPHIRLDRVFQFLIGDRLA
ncbi:YcjX family protein [Amorphus orientalis]|uniref:YcjX-like family ATPase n=2 Tax=Bacteria TaxID=2 RepID=A0AAE3VSU9_9HYPH|nr:YcjX family protein [Amorphus orientalis]MDQ0317528.1 putative YcjX-like family ATPase [Amorphus orientalis]